MNSSTSIPLRTAARWIARQSSWRLSGLMRSHFFRNTIRLRSRFAEDSGSREKRRAALDLSRTSGPV